MTAQIVAIGDEILIGQTLDTNSNYIAKNLTENNIEVISIQTIADDKEEIENILKKPEADVVIFTGGLGPTKDDITKKTLANFFQSELVFNEEVFKNIQQILFRIGRTDINELNRQQALVPANAKALLNKVGTAPGMYIQHNHTHLFFTPGIPFEMKYLFQNEILPILRELPHHQEVYRRNIMIYGIPESELALRLENWENKWSENFSVAYLPTAGIVKMRISHYSNNKEEAELQLDRALSDLQNIIGENIVSIEENATLASLIGAFLKKNQWNISTAESFTAGRIIEALTSVSGSSAYVNGGIVPYKVSIKNKILGVDSNLLEQHTAVSAEVAEEMVRKSAEMFQSEVAISSTGVAGPTKDESNNAIGLAFIGLYIKGEIFVKKFYYPHLERDEFSNLVSKVALEFLLKKLRDL